MAGLPPILQEQDFATNKKLRNTWETLYLIGAAVKPLDRDPISAFQNFLINGHMRYLPPGSTTIGDAQQDHSLGNRQYQMNMPHDWERMALDNPARIRTEIVLGIRQPGVNQPLLFSQALPVQPQGMMYNPPPMPPPAQGMVQGMHNQYYNTVPNMQLARPLPQLAMVEANPPVLPLNQSTAPAQNGTIRITVEKDSTSTTKATTTGSILSQFDQSPKDVLAQVITTMGIDLAIHRIGYRLPGDTKSGLPHELKSEEDMAAALDKIKGIITRAKMAKDQKALVIINVILAEYDSPSPETASSAPGMTVSPSAVYSPRGMKSS
ncbi:hypothetical protein BS47DRAFT_1357959, partial [Hydnum rufescens UP504]